MFLLTRKSEKGGREEKRDDRLHKFIIIYLIIIKILIRLHPRLIYFLIKKKKIICELKFSFVRD